jgi:hypothetical protein
MASASALAIGQEDLDVFERLLGEIQTAYAREDAETFGRMTTPEMLSYFSRDLADNAKKVCITKSPRASSDSAHWQRARLSPADCAHSRYRLLRGDVHPEPQTARARARSKARGLGGTSPGLRILRTAVGAACSWAG